MLGGAAALRAHAMRCVGAQGAVAVGGHVQACVKGCQVQDLTFV